VKEGIYTLFETITNPKPDRRQTRDWTQCESWDTTRKYLVREDTVFARETAATVKSAGVKAGPKLYTVHRVHGMTRSYTSLNFIERPDGAIEANTTYPKQGVAMLAFLAALTPSTDKIDEFRWAFFKDFSDPDNAACDVLWRLVKADKVTVADIERVLAARDEDDE